MQTASLIFSLNIKRILLVIMVACIFSLTSHCYSEDKEDETIKKMTIPPGMTITKVGNFYILTAKDSKVRHEGNFGQIISPEGPEEFSARKLIDVDERFKKDEADIETLKKDVAELREAVNVSKGE
jgi:hypothetical protein